MHDDTSIGGRSGRFPQTRWSAVAAARSEDSGERQRGYEALVAAYWKPVYKYIRLRWGKSNEDAKDLTQEFFARLMEKGFLDGYDARRARLRTFLRVCVDGVVQNEDRAARRQKRGGDAVMVPLDFQAAESELARAAPAASRDMEAYFEREWVRSLFELVVEELRAECAASGKELHFRLFERYDLEESEAGLTYEALAKEVGIAVTDVTNHLAWARRAFRRKVLERLRAMTAGEEEFRREARSLLGVEAE